MNEMLDTALSALLTNNAIFQTQDGEFLGRYIHDDKFSEASTRLMENAGYLKIFQLEEFILGFPTSQALTYAEKHDLQVKNAPNHRPSFILGRRDWEFPQFPTSPLVGVYLSGQSDATLAALTGPQSEENGYLFSICGAVIPPELADQLANAKTSIGDLEYFEIPNHTANLLMKLGELEFALHVRPDTEDISIFMFSGGVPRLLGRAPNTAFFAVLKSMSKAGDENE